MEPKKAPEICLLKNELEFLQEAVSIGTDYTGLIEIINLDRGVCLLYNEEGKLIGLEPNRRLYNDIICGVFYILGEDKEFKITSKDSLYIEKVYYGDINKIKAYDACVIKLKNK